MKKKSTFSPISIGSGLTVQIQTPGPVIFPDIQIDGFTLPNRVFNLDDSGALPFVKFRAWKQSKRSAKGFAKMLLQFYINENGDKVYTTKKESPVGLATKSAHPARFSPDDKFLRQRVLLKKRFGLLPIQQSPLKY